MKKLLTLVIAVVIGFGTMFANPVDVNTAQSLGQMFVKANFEKAANADLQLYYTVTSDNGVPCAYVFNLGNEGFVIVAASDNVRPILGYSEEGPFDASNPYNGAMYMLESYKNSVSHAIEKNVVATPDVIGEWTSLENCGKLSSKKANKVGPLVKTKWNQNSPYNLYAPAASGGPGGRCYAGCVATAMSQLMKRWNYPEHGTGSHGYNCYGESGVYYGYLSANFGNTTYDWENMPNTLGSNQTQIEAVATLMYHCGVAVDMQFDFDGSGAISSNVPGPMSSYFGYGSCQYKQRSSYSLTNWNNMLKEDFDLGHPVYYSGRSSEGGHAFVCDGYDENDLMHFNFGWSGSGDGWFAVDAIDYSTNAAAIFNFVPTPVYQNTALAPTNLTATRTSDVAQEATITWTNPIKTMNNQNLTTIDQIVLTRNDEVIYTVNNATPGASMTYVDNTVPCYSTFEYKVYAVKSDVNGKAAKTSESFGPTCQWKIIATSNNMAGWKSGAIIAYDGAGRKIDEFTMTNNTPTTYNMYVTLGKVSFAWKAGSDATVQISYKIKNSAGTVVYEQSQGPAGDIAEGVFYEGNNTCGNTAPTTAPTNLYTTDDGDNIILSWDATTKTDYGYNVYRDGLLCALTHTNEFVDEAPTVGGHCYQVCTLSDGGESPLSNEACGTAGTGCDPAYDLWFTLQTNGKPTITWEHPENASSLSGYYIYAKMGENGEYKKIKTLGNTKKEYKETRTLTAGNWYYYKVVAYYQSTDCYAAPAKNMYENAYYVKVFYDPDHQGVEENMTQAVEVYPNPAKDALTVKAEKLSNVTVYNMMGQKMMSQDVDAEEVTINTCDFEAGIYMVRIIADGNETTRKISVVK